MSKVILALAMLVSISASAAERYIIPIWGLRVQGATGEYTGTIAMTNLGDKDATVKVTKIVPILAHPCPIATCGASQWTLPPQLTRVVSDQGSGIVLGSVLDLGAVELESDRPIFVASEVFRGVWPIATAWQSVEVAREWITGESMIPRAIPLSGTFKLYLINPNDFPIRFDYHSFYGTSANALVAADSISVIDLDASFLCTACGGAEQPTGMAFPLYVKADFPYLAAVAIRSTGVSPDVRIARPLTTSN